MANKKFTSGALQVNLEETRTAEINIPDSHKEIIALSKDHWGINKRTFEFFQELHHPYSNYGVVVEEYRKILLGDKWFYQKQEDSGHVFLNLLNIAAELFRMPLKEEELAQLLRSYLEFFGSCEQADEVCSEKLLHHLVEQLNYLLENRPELLVKHADQLKTHLGWAAGHNTVKKELFTVLHKIVRQSLEIWRSTSPAEEWFNKYRHLFSRDYSEVEAAIGAPFFERQHLLLSESKNWSDLCDKVLFYNEIAGHYTQMIDRFEKHIERFYYILFLLYLPGMKARQTQLLYALNKVLRNIRNEVDNDDFSHFLDNIFLLFEELKTSCMATVLDCVLTLGKEVIETKDKKLISYFENKLIVFGFVNPGSVYIQENWQLKTDPNHLKNIRVWLELIMHAPYTFRKLLSALIVNLRLGGIFIFDTDLFQRDITRLLNSDISPLYKQIKQLTRIFPVYFNEIGAEGELRDVTTVMDELSGRQDKLIHFLRKQVHIEGNNTHIELCRKIFRFWYDGEKGPLEEILPPDVSQSLDLQSRWFKGVNQLIHKLCSSRHCLPDDLLLMTDPAFAKLVEDTEHNNEDDKTRLTLLFKLYALLREKYSFDIADLTVHLKRYRFFTDDEVQSLQHLLAERPDEALVLIFDYIERLNQVIFDPEHSEGWESIYHKRHIAFGIPSMYGQYREDKFEALGLIFRLERQAARLMEDKVFSLKAEYVTARSLRTSFDILSLFRRGLELDGVSSQGFEANLKMLKYGLTSESFSLAQFINLFQFLAKNVKEITNTYFFGFYDQPLRVIIPRIFFQDKELSEKEKNQLITRHSETFYREIMSASFLIQQLDSYISRMVHTLQNMVDNFPLAIIRDIMSYNRDLVISPLYEESPEIDNQIFLGSKAYFQKKLYMQHFPVPPGFVLSTEVFRRRRAIMANASLKQEVFDLVFQNIKRLEEMTGRIYGGTPNPLLLSVRSGTAISMPGAMNTFLNVGLNDDIVEKLSRQPNFGWTSWDCYRRLLQSWGMTYGIERDVFDQVMIDFKERYKVEQKVMFTPGQMKEMAFAYKHILAERNIRFEEDPWLQLEQTIIRVFDSWDSERANVYRNHLQIADEWGTAVVIQQMVLGNIDDYSGTGVVFTHNPMVPKPGIYLNGDFTMCSQGEDIVAGLVHALPVSVLQKQLTGRENQPSLEEFMPDMYRRLFEIAHDLVEKKGYNHLEIEFTFESRDPSDLYILQIRDQETRKTERLQVFVEAADHMQLLGRGIGGGGGALNGRLAIDMDDIVMLRKKYPKESCILLRPDTVPDDIPIIFECDGLVASRGGTTSHAAVTAASLGKVCVLNCRQLHVNEKEKVCHINGEHLTPGDQISIDGFSGNIYKGHYKTDYTEILR
ncbi:MAG: PEP/pyruvate-binding domain-containing protein [Bacteroidales bacterium]|nr:PEP/pyruvate-binding domain-containing protein [Bacteroidales bacterium]